MPDGPSLYLDVCLLINRRDRPSSEVRQSVTPVIEPEESREGLMSFVERREARFVGR